MSSAWPALYSLRGTRFSAGTWAWDWCRSQQRVVLSVEKAAAARSEKGLLPGETAKQLSPHPSFRE